MRRSIHGLLSALVAVVGVSAPATAASGVSAPVAQAPVSGQIGIRLLDAPTERQDDPRAQTYIVDHLEPGTTIRRRVEVANTTDQVASISLYPASARVEAGAFAFDDGRAANELTGWTTVRPATLDVPVNGRAVAEVSIVVPDDATGGERYGVVWAEHRTPAGAGGVAAVSRVGVRMYLSVGGSVEPRSDFRVDSLTARRLADGTPVVEAMVHNTGRRALDMAGDMQLLDGPGGLSAGPFPATLGTTLAVGESAPVTVQLDPALPAGPWTARIALRSGQLERAVEGDISFPDENGTAADSVGVRDIPLVEDERVVVPFAIALLILVLLGLLWFFLWGRRRRKQDDDENESVPAAEGVPAVLV